MEFKGTKGQWKINKGIAIVSIATDEKLICVISGTEKKANAQLIASAPELLEMLQLTLIELESGAKGHWEITGMIKQAIEKATKID